MKIPMDLVIGEGDPNFDELDFYVGAKALEGASEAIPLIVNTILTRKLTKQIPSIEGLHANFKQSFKSSYGQRFEIEITGSEEINVARWLGTDGLIEIMQYLIGEAIGQPYQVQNKIAQSWVNSYIEDEFDLINKINGALQRMHKPVEAQGYNVRLRRRRKPIAILNQNTLDYISYEHKETHNTEIRAVITRFNKLTGTGRLILAETDPSISFSPGISWQRFPLTQRRKFSKNLDLNNGSDDFTPIKLSVRRVIGHEGVIKHFKVMSVILEDS
ncbi:hypothetical protein [Pseudomonas soli]|uniref:hypothetical protein n=1 Tax=Pseudomonas soli TaxID=1306993 RepID=UPI0028ADA129|nr:hypothetical protein [Pseudomonas soli]MDW9402618.1 hypothetical protein [Pseudomonas soli]